MKIFHILIIFPVLADSSLIAATKGKPRGSREPDEITARQSTVVVAEPAPGPSPGSLFAPNSRMADLGRDLRANQVNDIVSIVVSDSASAVSKGTSNTSRKTSANSSITAAAGVLSAASRLPSLASMSGDQQLQGQGQTTRQTTLTTSLSARVIEVMPNGNLVIEGSKDILVNSERQWILVRGVIRPSDLGPANSIRSEKIAGFEIRINGKGVVGDAIRRPNFLYRLILGLLPF
ncbi:MAG: flagellar basal body L-ring protein FlgH [Bryobacteraceae bacterium]